MRRGDVVIVIDPKNSRRLKRVTQRACEDWREPDTFLEFHPAFPEAGVRPDFTFNWQKPTEIARDPVDHAADTAGAFRLRLGRRERGRRGWSELEERPNLVKLTKYIEGGIEPVLEATLRRFYERPARRLARPVEMKKLLHDAHRGNMKRPSEAASADLLAWSPSTNTTSRSRSATRCSTPGAHLPPQPRALPEDHRQPARCSRC